MAVNSQYDSQHGGEAARLPVSLHPAFPAIVALWFAALLGIGSLVLPALLLDRVVSVTGLASLLPAASPPLGMTARSIIAIAGALAGAALGVAVARRVAGARAPKDESLAAGSRRPISVHDELGGEGVINGQGLPISRLRALAISEDDRPSDFLYRAPLPGEDPDAPAPFAAAPFVSAVPDDEPLELSDLAREDDEQDADADLDMTDTPEIPSSWPSRQHYPRGIEPLSFAAPSLARRAPEVEAEPELESEPEPELQLAFVAVEEAAEVRADWQTAPLDGLGLVQLVQRLRATIECRRELMANAAAQPPAEPTAFAEPDLEPAAPEDAVQAMAAFFGSARALKSEAVPATEPTPAPPEFFRSHSPPDENHAEEEIPDFSLPLRRPAAPADNDAADDEPGASEQGFSSLLGIGNPFAAPKSEFVRVEEPEEEAGFAEPAVVFPGQQESGPGSHLFNRPGKSAAPARAAPQVPADAEAALRAALATLQRMSGAA